MMKHTENVFFLHSIKATVQHLPLIGAILGGVLAMCSVPSQIVLISKILRS